MMPVDPEEAEAFLEGLYSSDPDDRLDGLGGFDENADGDGDRRRRDRDSRHLRLALAIARKAPAP